jgi:hypothetical protein
VGLWKPGNDLRAPCTFLGSGSLLLIRFERVPNKSKLIESLPPRLRYRLMSLITHPLTEAKAVFFVGSWDATMALALLVDRQIAEAFRPVRFERVPNKSKPIQLLSAWCR